MLPSGHLAGGYLVSVYLLQKLAVVYPQASSGKFLAAGLLASILPDFDVFYIFYRIGNWIETGNGKMAGINHRKLASHAPLVYALLSFAAFLAGRIAGNSDLELFSIMFLAGTWTHFALDSTFYGIMWLWPFSIRQFAISNPGIDSVKVPPAPFFSYWKNFLISYARNFTSWIEAVIILAAALVYLKIF